MLNQLQKYQRSTRDLETEIQEAEARYAHVQGVLQKCENDLARALPSTHPSATLSTLVDKVTIVYNVISAL